MRGAGLASVRWPFSGAIVGAITGRFRRTSDTRLEATIKENIESQHWLADCHYHLFEYETEILI